MKAKAKQLVEKFMYCEFESIGVRAKRMPIHDAKDCALICIERDITFFDNHKYEWFGWEDEYAELLEVKKEINKL